jgi:hypothetical protein
MRRPAARLLLALAAASLALPALSARAGDVGPRPTERPSSAAQLVERGLAALAAGKADGYLALLPTVDDMKRYCPGELTKDGRTIERLNKELERMHAQVRKEVAACHALFDWNRAKRVSLEAGDRRKKVANCDAVEELEDPRAVYEIDGKRFVVLLDDPFVLDGRIFGVSDAPRCREEPPPPAPGPQPRPLPPTP